MSVEDGWHPVGLSHSIEAGSSAGTRLFDQELVVWRDNSGAAHVWEDRCPHRGMKLSFGFVRGEHIACLYHGWQYNSGGHCQYIPAHPALDVPKTIKVPVYSVREQSGMIWTTLSPNPTVMPEADEPVVPLRSLYLDCSRAAAIATLSASRLVSFEDQAVSDRAVGRLSDTLFAISAGQDRLLVGVQSVSSARTAFHLAICGAEERYRGDGQNHFNRWALELRQAVEQPRAAVSVPERDVA
jgi:nitrite reductase/ring-hydroxylating ferredoxin subunit